VASAPVTVTDCGNNIIGVPSHLLFLVMPKIMNGTILVEKCFGIALLVILSALLLASCQEKEFISAVFVTDG